VLAFVYVRFSFVGLLSFGCESGFVWFRAARGSWAMGYEEYWRFGFVKGGWVRG